MTDKVYKIEGEAFTRIFDLRKKQEERIKAAKDGEEEFRVAILTEVGISKEALGKPMFFDDRYESTGVYFLKEMPPHPIAQIINAMRGAAESELCPDCGLPHEAGDVTKH